jgi:hypothetical protein
MKHNIIKTDNYLLIVSDEEIKIGDLALNLSTKNWVTYMGIKGLDSHFKKIIYHLPLNNSRILEGVDLLPPIEDEVDELADELTSHLTFPEERRVGIVLGYNKAKEKYKYTEEDMRKVCIMYAQWVTGGTPSLRIAQNPDERFEQIIQSLQQPKYPIGFECEMVTRVLDVYPQTINHIPKTTTNSQGQTQLVGTYIYEN